MTEKHPDVTAGSSNLYQNWEVVDPEKWVPHDYVCVRVDSRGAGCSPGFIDHFSPRETKDFYDCIEWAGVQPWSNGKVGLNGISYYGINQWHVASLQPPHLAAMCIWEGAADWYRDMTHHGGILSTFWENWYDMQVKTVQYGAGERGKRSRVHGDLVCGPETLSEEELARNRCDFGARDPRASAGRRLSQGALAEVGQGDDAAVLGGQLGRPGPAPARQFRRLRARRLQAEMARSARHRALDALLHRLRPRAAAALLRSFPARQGQRLGEAAARCCCRSVTSTKFVPRAENEWPLKRTQWTKFYLDPASMTLTTKKPSGNAQAQVRRHGRRAHVPHAAARAGNRDHRPVGAQAVRVVVDAAMPTSSSCCASSPATSRRSCSRARSIRTRRSRKAGCAPRTASSTRNCRSPTGPITPTTRSSRSSKGQAVELDIEIWPTSIVVPAGYRIGAVGARQGLRIWRRPAAASCRTSRTS